MSTRLHMLNVEWIPLYGLQNRFKQVKVEKAKHHWVTIADDRLRGYLRIVDKRAVYLSPAEDEAFIEETKESLAEPFAEIEELEEAYHEASRFNLCDTRLVFYSDGKVSTPYDQLTWFAGQRTVNRMLKPLNLGLVEDYDGIARVEAMVGRPYNLAKIRKAARLIAEGLHLYSAIKKAQESRALETTIAMLPLIRERIDRLDHQ